MTDEDARTRAQAFVRQVEQAMAGLPRSRRAELTGGLVDHLLEPGDDGRRPIDDELDPRSYADDLQATALPNRIQRAGGRMPYMAGAALLGLVVAISAWLGLAQPWSRESAQPGPAASPTTSPSPAQVWVPDVRGLSRAQALSAVESSGLAAEVVVLSEGHALPMTAELESGAVAQTDPFAGTLVDEGSVVVLMLIP